MPPAAQNLLAPDVALEPLTFNAVRSEFRELRAAGAELRPAGTAARRPEALIKRGYGPQQKLRLFDLDIYLGGPWQNEDLRFFVAYVSHPDFPKRVYPRLFYKDVSLTWRCASHYIPSENWIGKGALKVIRSAGELQEETDEATTDLPLEMQTALEDAARNRGKIPYDRRAVSMVLRNAPPGRLEPYADFSKPRELAARQSRNLVNGGRSIARFTRRNDPSSLVMTQGFEPDFHAGVISQSQMRSTLYGGKLTRYRVASTNQLVQYSFIAAPRHAWIASVQATTRTLSTYALRVVDACVDEALLLPGYEWHFLEDDDDPTSLYSQIPDGFAGAPSAKDPSRADATAWHRGVAMIREFRRMADRGKLRVPR